MTTAWLLRVLLLLPLATFSQASSEIVKDKDGITVYTMAVRGSEFKSFKAVVLVNASKADIIRLVQDADNYTKWYGYTKASKVLKREAGVQYNYVETIFPWPYSNRDMVYKMEIDTTNSATTKISINGMPDYVLKKKGIVRMQKADGYMSLKSIGGATEVTYVFHSEPGADVPSWLANSSIAELPYKTLKGLREMLKENGKGNR